MAIKIATEGETMDTKPRFTERCVQHGLMPGCWYRVFHAAHEQAPSLNPSTVAIVLGRRMRGVEVLTEAGVVKTFGPQDVRGDELLTEVFE
jgi:hypothetical protein